MIARLKGFTHAKPKLRFPGTAHLPNDATVCRRYVGANQLIRPIVIQDIGANSGTWSISGTLPTGLSHSNGTISGTVDAGASAQTHTLTVTRTNSAGASSVTFQIIVHTAFTEIDSGDAFPYNCSTANRLYVCTEPCVSDGTLFAINASGVALDLGGFTHTYDNSTPITIPNHSFEDGSGSAATGWDFTNAPNAERWEGSYQYNEVYDGSYSIKFNDTTATEYIESTATIELLPNTTYTLSGMFEYGGQGNWTNPGVVMYVSLVGTGGEDTVTCNGPAQNNRGIQWTRQEFTTGAGTPTYNARVGITGHASSTRPVFIDDVRVQTVKRYGVMVTPFAVTGDVGDGGTITDGYGTNAKITNGTLQQGTGHGSDSHAIAIRGTGGLFVQQVNGIVSGHNSSFMSGYDMGALAFAVVVDNCDIISNVRTLFSRDNGNAAVINGMHGQFSNNTIRNGPHVGINAKFGNLTTNKTPSDIYNNRIYMKIKYTNGFGIIGSYQSQVHDNVILLGTGDYQGRGIMIGSGLSGAPSRVYNNRVEVQNLPVNQEYELGAAFGQYGIQLEIVSHCEIFNNHVTARSSGLKTVALRINAETDATGIKIHNNTFIAIASDVSTGMSTCLKLSPCPADSVDFRNNTLITNNELITEAAEAYLVLRNCYIAIQNQLASSKTINLEFPYTNSFDFIDCTFADSGSRTALENATMVRFNSATTESGTTTTLQWTTTVHVENAAGAPVAGATVTIDDTAASEVFSGTTNAQGNVTTEIIEWSTTAGTRTTKNDHTTDASGSGLTGQEVFTADQSQSITIVAA